MVKIKGECTVNFEESLTFYEAEIEVLDKEEGNKFLNISLKDKAKSKVSLVISTDDLKRILEAAEGGWEQLLKKAITDKETKGKFVLITAKLVEDPSAYEGKSNRDVEKEIREGIEEMPTVPYVARVEKVTVFN